MADYRKSASPTLLLDQKSVRRLCVEGDNQPDEFHYMHSTEPAYDCVADCTAARK